MTNPQDNLGTHTPPFPSHSTIPPPPSTSSKPRLRRVKMLAQKTVASGALRKKLNKNLKGSQAQISSSSSDSKSYQSATEGEGPGSSDSEKTQEYPFKEISSENLESRFTQVGYVKDVEVPGSERSGERVEESGMKSGRSGSGEATEGTPTTKAPNVPKPSKKRMASSPTPIASSLPRGIAKRSRVKLSEVDLQRALKENKKKKMDKGKGKIAEPSEAIEEEEMELVHKERGTSVEVPTPKPKKPKTSSKKSSSVSEAGEPTLAKKTRSAVKTKQSKISEDDDWSGEEEEENDSEKE
uniref:Nucleolin 2-like n=1 Tax=Nicotiana tabacum TaxID=4097 RepID=A0A1S3ZCF3_TOBAC|nr:PREDICTED: nucleolin 2-like [Nicotiana tabacum]